MTILKRKNIQKHILCSFWNVFNKILLPFSHYGIINAISGGTDSRLFLEAIGLYPYRYIGKFINCIVNHYTRKLGNFESYFLFHRSQHFGFDTFISNLRRKDVFLSNEKILRAKRFNSFSKVLKRSKSKSLVILHTKSDNVESFLMFMLGYSGSNWGSYMPIIRQIKNKFILRPLMYFNKFQVSSALCILKIFDYFRDLSNTKNIYKRSLIRNQLVYFLCSLNINNISRFDYLSKHLFTIKNYFNKQIYITKKKVFLPLFTKIPKHVFQKILFKNLTFFITNKYKCINIVRRLVNLYYNVVMYNYLSIKNKYIRIKTSKLCIKILSNSLIIEET